MTDSSWQDRAECVNEPPELFFPPGDSWLRHRAQAAEAKAVCARCPVRAECLDAAIAEGDESSIRGGLTPRQRRHLKSARRAS